MGLSEVPTNKVTPVTSRSEGPILGVKEERVVQGKGFRVYTCVSERAPT